MNTTASSASPRRPTMTDVAGVAGVSLKTVSRVVNGVSSVDEHLAARVRAAAQELGFRTNFAASTLRSGSSSATIGLLIKDLSNDFYATIASGVAEVARAHHTQLITAHSGENAADELEAIFDLCRRRVDGLLIVPTGGDHSALRSEIDLGIPMVFIDRSPIGLDADSVVLDNYASARDATLILIAEGHIRIGILVDTLNMPTMWQRVEGIKAAYLLAGLPWDDSLLVTNVRGPAEASMAVDRLIARTDPPTAYFCGNNRSSIGALRTLWERRRTEALVAFDDFQLAELMPRPFRVLRYDNRALGTLGAELLFRRINGEVFAPVTVVLPTELCARGISEFPFTDDKEPE
ncbi:LacI family DNA-binding transcriptional regulator [Cryobacterium sp. TMT2-23]|uniref:LacI family DNA-binding transcriptional regulator n=1 Tax=Cryobacterium sp. TMT2-23 TaxID=1259252 RepID=UPI0018E0794C|nr:LacI family DNA-binding transcriptional regulator [Cryobacterium sp. TMT2-23]